MAKMIDSIVGKLKPFFKTHKQKLIIGGAVLIAISLLCGIVAAIYLFFRLFFPSFVCVLILFYLGYRTLYFVCQTLTFPGSRWLWRRNLEMIYGRATANRLKEYINDLISLSEYILDTNEHKCWQLNSETSSIREVIESLCDVYLKQEENKTLSQKQKLLAKHFDELKQLLQKINVAKNVSGSVEIYTYWTILYQDLDLSNSHDVISLSFENEGQGKQVLELCKKIMSIFDEFLSQKKLHALYRWFTNDSFGSLNQIREQLAERYGGKQIFLKVANNISLDCMLLPSYQSQDHSRQHSTTSRASTENDDSIHIMDSRADARFANPTIIFCNPNAAYYELMYFDNDWIEFYLRRGVNVFLWNYRGYGRSGGSPSPLHLKNDGEQIVKYLKTTYNVKKLGAHGTSLGGFVVSHLAKHANLEYACADRTFSSLANVAEKGQGFILGKLFAWVTGWTDDSGKNFADANCYKILTFDPKDEIIPYLASLRNGVTNSVAERLLEFDSGAEPGVTPKKKSNLFTSRGFSVMKLRFLSWFKADTKQVRGRASHEYHEILTPEQLSALYYSLRRISEIFFERSKVEAALRNRRNIQHTPVKPKKPVADSSAGLSKLETSSDGLDVERLETDEFDETSPIRVNPSLQKKLIGKDDLSLKINEANHKSKTEFPTSSQPIKSYLPLLQEEMDIPEDFLRFISSTFMSFSSLEAGGIALIDLLSDKKSTLEHFKDFILSFEIWGSIYPLKGNFQDMTQGYRQKRAITQIEQFLLRFESLVKSKPTLQGALEKALSEDVEVISNGFSVVHQKLNLLYDRNYPEGIELTTYGRPSPVKEALHQGRSLNANQKGVRNSFLEVGHLLPLSCGHNGSLSRSEMLAFESYFMSSDFVKL